MAEDASEYLTIIKSVSSVVPSVFFRSFSKTELFSYLILCVAKMPFIPPVSIARSGLSGLAGKERTVSSTFSTTEAKAFKDDKSNSVKERLTLNLKQLGKKSPPRSHLPTAKGRSGPELHSHRKDRLLTSSHKDHSPASGRTTTSKSPLHKYGNHSSTQRESEAKTSIRDHDESHFTLTLTPEAVVLLQRRNSERRQRSANRNSVSGASAPGSVMDNKQKRENTSKRHQPATQRNRTQNGRIAAKDTADSELLDINSIMKISLLNEQHRYDDVEYEEEDEYAVDERVILKCTEWLRGLENTPVTVGNSLMNSADGVKTF